MATTPAGWTQRTINPQEYEAILDLGNFNKYEVNVNVQTGQRQIYTIDAVLQTRQLLATVNANGTVTKTNVYNNIAVQPNGQTRIKNILDASRTAANKIVGSVGTEQQKTSLANQKEYGKLKSGLQGSTTPPTPGGGSQDTGGPNSGGDNSATEESTPLAGFRNVANFQSETDKYGFWQYPLEMNLSQDHMIITTYNYQVADVFAGSNGTSDINSGLIFDGDSLSSRTLKEILGKVTLPMPANISEANQTGWGEDSLNNLAAGLMGGAVKAVGSIGDGKLIDGTADLVETAKGVFNSAGAKSQIRQQLTLNAASSLVKKLGVNINTEGYRARVTGTVINPNLELLFNGPKLRAFQFAFKLAPRSAREAQQVRGIIKFFKKSMAPKRPGPEAGGTGDEFFLGAPNVFKIEFRNGKNPHNGLPTLKTCALVNFNVNYTADGFYSAYNDGQPVSVEIQLSFAELTPIYNDNYGTEDSVGFAGGSANLDNLENPQFTPSDVSEQQNAADNANQPRRQDPSQPGAGVSPGSPVPALITDVNGRPTAATPGSLALPAN
jgi:hypothetical protein